MAFGITVCSNALLMLGAHPISDYAEDNERARLCSNLYPTTRDSVLRAHSWNCAVKRMVFSPEVKPPAFGFAYSYTLPADFLRLLDINTTYYQIEGGKLLCDIDELHIRYIWRNEDDTTWDSALFDVMVLRMAATMAYNITGSSALRDSYSQEAKIALMAAKAIDGQENPPEELEGSLLLEARRG